MRDIASVAPTVCRLMGVPLPNSSTPETLEEVASVAEAVLRGKPVEKCFVYAPDAIGEVLYQDFAREFEPVIRIAPVQALLRSMFPPKTPVCFASMFSGLHPEEHGIRGSEKPVLACDTVFDVLARFGKKLAIVSVAGCSISLIFKERPISYFTETYDQQVNDRVLQLLEDSDCDFILAYNQEYDDATHETTPRSEKALKAMRNHISSFHKMGRAFLDQYREQTRLIVFAPDHGAHLDSETGKGTHDLDICEDMLVRSFWGVYDKELP